MSDVHKLSERQKQAARWLSNHVGSYLARSAVIRDTGLSEPEYDGLLELLANLQCVEIVPVDDGIVASDFAVLARIREIVRQLDNPPLRNRVQETKDKFNSKVWAVPVILGLAVLSAIALAASNLDTLLKWFGIK
jgi:hypothetical protein